jgi:hypothetical protein
VKPGHDDFSLACSGSIARARPIAGAGALASTDSHARWPNSYRSAPRTTDGGPAT